jgi:phosphoribosylformimino-5-aminoimidazole carboxamide ribotide isomerase
MLIIPAIDLLDGKCVQLLQGNYDEATVYENDPAGVATRFEQAGAKRLHIVDLDAARGDRRTNRKRIIRVRRAVTCTIELGGGIRSDQDIENVMDLGIDRMVLGTVVVRKPRLVEGWCAKYGGIFLAGIDAKDGTVMVSGWEESTSITDLALAERAKTMGIGGIIYTSISQDGTMQGPDIERTNAIAEKSGLPVILSGGVASIEDLERIEKEGHPGVKGAIVGTAIYEKKIDLSELFTRFPQDQAADIPW